ncbi:MAG: carboxypeptidase-like regulatory domain-containing protein, partial [Polyangiaceae bacterium]
MQRQRRSPFLTFGIVGASALLVASLAAACGGPNRDSGFDTGGDGSSNGEGGGFGIKGSGEGGPCTGIACNVAQCGSAPDTTISGTVFAPNGTLPLYNVIVYVPNSPISPFTNGVSCDTCGQVSGNPVTSTVSNPDGTFKLTGVPNGANIPLVFQVGKWRRQVTISNVAKCADNPIADPNMERLPKNHTEGDMPNIAISTGSYDSIACVLPKMGIDSSEFGIQSDYGSKKIIFYQGNTGGGPSINNSITPAQNLWSDINELKKYDLTILSCEGDEELSDKPSPDQATMYNYLEAGGRTFETDFMYTWISDGPTPLPTLMTGFTGGAPFESKHVVYSVDTSFPKGVALDAWLQVVGRGGTATTGQIDLGADVFYNFSRVNTALGQRWVYGDTDKIISFTAPLDQPEASRCGKSYFMDVHVSVPSVAGGDEDVDTTFPTSCNSKPLTSQEKAMV